MSISAIPICARRRTCPDGLEVLQSGDLAGADSLIGQLQAARPDHPLVNYLLGALRIQQGRSAEALGPLEMAYEAMLTEKN